LEVALSTCLTELELATVLAALRYWQQYLAENDEPLTVTPLTVYEIDDFCERLNDESAI
jgi:hypothetical protein